MVTIISHYYSNSELLEEESDSVLTEHVLLGDTCKAATERLDVLPLQLVDKRQETLIGICV